MIDANTFRPVIGQNPPDGDPVYWVRTTKEPILTISFWPYLKHVMEDDAIVLGNEFRLHKENVKAKKDIVYAGLIGIDENTKSSDRRIRLIALRPTTTERKIKPYVDTIVNMYRYMIRDLMEKQKES